MKLDQYYLAEKKDTWYTRCDCCSKDIYLGEEYWRSGEYFAILCSEKCVKKHFDLEYGYVQREDI